MAKTIDFVRPQTERDNLYFLALKQWGREAQIIQAMEELSELNVLLAKYVNSRLLDLDALYSEIADAEIMIEQLRMIFSGARIDILKEKKLARLENTLTVATADEPLQEGAE